MSDVIENTINVETDIEYISPGTVSTIVIMGVMLDEQDKITDVDTGWSLTGMYVRHVRTEYQRIFGTATVVRNVGMSITDEKGITYGGVILTDGNGRQLQLFVENTPTMSVCAWIVSALRGVVTKFEF